MWTGLAQALVVTDGGEECSFEPSGVGTRFVFLVGGGAGPPDDLEKWWMDREALTMDEDGELAGSGTCGARDGWVGLRCTEGPGRPDSPASRPSPAW